jgi:hypothetical protein
MIAQTITFAADHPFAIGLAIGGMGFGGVLGIIGWGLGHDAAMRKVGHWMRPKIDEVHGDVPTLPPIRERRPIATTPGRYL